MKKSEIAEEYFRKGYNCSQSVVLSFKDEMGLDEETLMKLSVGLGGGVGRMREVCGAICGGAIVIGYLKGSTDPKSKNEVYPIVQRLGERFKESNGSIVCRELLAGIQTTGGSQAEARTDEFYKKRPCLGLIMEVADIVDDILNE